jgi:hypothetical protein
VKFADNTTTGATATDATITTTTNNNNNNNNNVFSHIELAVKCRTCQNRSDYRDANNNNNNKTRVAQVTNT